MLSKDKINKLLALIDNNDNINEQNASKLVLFNTFREHYENGGVQRLSRTEESYKREINSLTDRVIKYMDYHSHYGLSISRIKKLKKMYFNEIDVFKKRIYIANILRNGHWYDGDKGQYVGLMTRVIRLTNSCESIYLDKIFDKIMFLVDRLHKTDKHDMYWLKTACDEIDKKGNTGMVDKVESLLLKGTLFGSRAWGCSTSNSDWDYLVTNRLLYTILDVIKKYDESLITYTGSGTSYDGTTKLFNTYSVEFAIKEKTINLVSYDDIEYTLIVMCNNDMLRAIKTPNFSEAIKDKQKRYRIFEELVILRFGSSNGNINKNKH